MDIWQKTNCSYVGVSLLSAAAIHSVWLCLRAERMNHIMNHKFELNDLKLIIKHHKVKKELQIQVIILYGFIAMSNTFHIVTLFSRCHFWYCCIVLHFRLISQGLQKKRLCWSTPEKRRRGLGDYPCGISEELSSFFCTCARLFLLLCGWHPAQA